MDFKNSKTFKNLKAAFAGESQARNKYSYYASKASKEGYTQIANFFLETAENEKEHAKLWFKLFHGIDDTYENLIDAASGENFEWVEMYKEFAQTAKEEGFLDIAAQLEGVANIEAEHEARFRALANNIKEEKVFKKEEEVTWQCGNCGYIVKGKDAPEVCPVCKHSQGYFFMRKKNY